jgi:sterol desaturase/sphingolipid hydroxylase (fatty acid hydroxylase superfamily)
MVTREWLLEKRTMTPLQIAVLIGLLFVALKFIASAFGYGNVPLLNNMVTVILSIFVTFEIVKLIEAIALRFGMV